MLLTIRGQRPHQAQWLAIDAQIKLCEKGRRTGITFAEALDSVITAASQKSASGMDCFYIGDTKEKGLEFIGYCAKFSRVIAQAQASGVSQIEEFLFPDQDEAGNTRQINAYRIRYASGFKIVALSSNPASVRGLQGKVIIDEAAFHRNVSAVLDAATALLIWGGRIVIISTHNGKAKPAEWFFYDQHNTLRFRAKDAGPDGEPCDPQRFIVARQDATYANPYGFPDLSMCFWPATFMKGGLKYWVQFTEKYGSPWVIGKHPRGATDDETNLLLDSLEAMVQDAVAAIPDDASVQIIEAAGKAGSADVYRQLLEYCRSEINVAMLGQNQTTEKDSNRASATAGAEVTQDIRDGDASIVATALNACIRHVVDLNFGTHVAAPVYQLWQQEEIDKSLAQRDKALTESGVRFSNTYWQRTYNLQDGDLQKASATAATPAFAEPSIIPVLDQIALDQAIQSLPPATLQQHSQRAIAPLIEAIQQSQTDTDALGLLAESHAPGPAL